MKLLDVQRFQDVVTAHTQIVEAKVEEMGICESIEYTAAHLEEKALSFEIDKLKLDVNIYRNHAAKYKDREVGEHHAKLEWANERQKESRDFAGRWIKADPVFCVFSLSMKDANLVSTAYVNFVKGFESKLGHNATTAIPSSIPCIPLGEMCPPTPPPCPPDEMYTSLLPTWACPQCHPAPARTRSQGSQAGEIHMPNTSRIARRSVSSHAAPPVHPMKCAFPPYRNLHAHKCHALPLCPTKSGLPCCIPHPPDEICVLTLMKCACPIPATTPPVRQTKYTFSPYRNLHAHNAMQPLCPTTCVLPHCVHTHPAKYVFSQ